MESHCLIILVKFRWTLNWNWGLFHVTPSQPTYPTFSRLYFSPSLMLCDWRLFANEWWVNRHWGGLNVISVATKVFSVAIFPLMMIFALLVQRKTWSQIYAIHFISVMQACLTITANFVLISWFSRSDKFMKPLLTILSLGCYLL